MPCELPGRGSESGVGLLGQRFHMQEQARQAACGWARLVLRCVRLWRHRRVQRPHLAFPPDGALKDMGLSRS